MATSSLAALKGTNTTPKAKAPPVATKAKPAPAPEPEVEETEVEIDVDTMDAKALDALVAEHSIEVPDNWGKMKVGAKRDWLKAQFSDEPAEEAEQEDAAEPEEAEAEEAEEADAEEAEAEAEPEPEPAPKKKALVTKKAAPVEEAAPVAAKKPSITKAKPKAEPVEEEAVAEEPAPKAKPAGKAVAVTKQAKKVVGEVLQNDVLTDVGVEIENLKEADAKAMVGQLMEDTDFTWFKLGGVLSRILDNSWYAPYAKFSDFVKQEHNIEYRTALYWVNTYKALIEAEIPWAKIKDIGWAKLKDLAPVLDLENVDEWVAIAKKNNVSQLAEIIRNAKAEAGDGLALPTSEANAIKTKTFKLHEDQLGNVEAALTKAREEGNTEVDSVALEYVCLSYLNNTGKAKGKAKVDNATAKAFLASLELEDAAQLLADAFPDQTLNITVE